MKKKKLKQAKKKSKQLKNRTVIIKARNKINVGKVEFFDVYDTYWARFKPGQKHKNADGLIVDKKTTSLNSIFIDKEGQATVHISVKLSHLKAFFKKLRKDEPKLRKIKTGKLLGIRHLSPDISFIVEK